MNDEKLCIAYCPTRRDVFSKQAAIEFSKRVKTIISGFDIRLVDLSGINDEELLFRDSDIPTVIEKFKREKVDAVFFPHCNFGSETLVALTARALGVPVLLWGPRDDAPDENGKRSRDSQCGLFATGKVLRRHNVTFTYLENSSPESEKFRLGFSKFLSVVRVVRDMREIRILQISTRPELFASVICNEGELLERFNVHICPVTLNDLVLETEKVKRENTDEFKAAKSFIEKIDRCGDKDAISKVASIKVAVASLAKRYRCSCAAIQCWNSLQDIFGVMPCLANAMLTDEGLPVVCETDICGAISTTMLIAASNAVCFFADLTVRHPTNDNAELLWHCGNFPYSLADRKKNATAGRNVYSAENCYGVCEWELKDGDITVARFDGDHGQYSLFIGEAHTTDGPKNVGSYVWIETSDWKKWEKKLVEGPYIHHVAGCFGHVGDILCEACKYIPGLLPDPVEPSYDDLKGRF